VATNDSVNQSAFAVTWPTNRPIPDNKTRPARRARERGFDRPEKDCPRPVLRVRRERPELLFRSRQRA
jgi:hypothetical protein